MPKQLFVGNAPLNHCHVERSEISQCDFFEMFRFAQHDVARLLHDLEAVFLKVLLAAEREPERNDVTPCQP